MSTIHEHEKMMLAAFNPALSTLSGIKRDSMCSIVSVTSQNSALDFLANPENVLDAFPDFDDGSTDFLSNESSPAKDKLLNLEFEDDDGLPSRKRRASRLAEPKFTGAEMLSGLGDSSSSLPNDLFGSSIDIQDFHFDDDGEFRPDVVGKSANKDEMDVVSGGGVAQTEERNRTFSQERRFIHSEILARLEKLDGVDLTDEADIMIEDKQAEDEPKVVVVENDGTPRPEDPEPKLGIYNEKQRVDRLNRYREKRKQLVYGRVRYVLRQKVSETRPRVKGRFVKQTGESSASPASTREIDSAASSSPNHSTGSPTMETPVRRVEFMVEPEESPAPKRGRTAWEMLKSLSLFSFKRSESPKAAKNKRPSLPANLASTFSEKLLMSRRKSTTAASTASGKARRRFSRDEFFCDEDEIDFAQEPDRKRTPSVGKWNL